MLGMMHRLWCSQLWMDARNDKNQKELRCSKLKSWDWAPRFRQICTSGLISNSGKIYIKLLQNGAMISTLGGVLMTIKKKKQPWYIFAKMQSRSKAKTPRNQTRSLGSSVCLHTPGAGGQVCSLILFALNHSSTGVIISLCYVLTHLVLFME